jgi:chitin deacetylase
MKKKLLLLALILIALGCMSILWHVSRSRTFQFFGELVPRVNTSQKVVALTFDDGPVPGPTAQILAILEQEHVRATFFVTGAELQANMGEGRRLVEAGHELGNHSFSHQRMLLVTPSFVKQEVETTDNLIREAGYQGPIHFRPPYGKKLFSLPYYLWKTGRKSITWDVEPDSFPEIASDANKIADFVLSQTQPGSIIILHVMYPSRIESMKAVKKIIEGLKAKGYSFKTVSELLMLGAQASPPAT